MNDMKTGGVAVLTAALALGASLAGAADYPQRKDLAARSAQEGLGRAEVGLLARTAGPGSEPTAQALLSRFGNSRRAVTTRGTAKPAVHKDSVSFAGDGWLLQVYADGTRVHYRNYDSLESKKGLGRPVADRLSLEKLEGLGRRFIATQLAGLVTLEAGDELVPLFTEHQISGGGPAREGAKPFAEKVMASTVVFGRAVDGVAVVGPGSKVAVLFTNDGEAVGFDYDWPKYARTGRTQRVLALGDIRERAHGLTAADLGAPGVTVKRIECGYFDAGARRRDAKAPIQAGCGIQYSQRTIVDAEANRRDPASGHTTAAFVEAIPAGAAVESDEGWPQAVSLTGGSPAPAAAEPPAVKP